MGRTFTRRSNPTTGSCGSYESILGGQGWYAITLRVDPANANVVYAGGLDIWLAKDEAATPVRIQVERGFANVRLELLSGG